MGDEEGLWGKETGHPEGTASNAASEDMYY